jgi:maltodextrin utilization protein YvdJ
VQLRSLLTCRTLEWGSGQPNCRQPTITSEHKTVWKSSYSCSEKSNHSLCREVNQNFACQARTAVAIRAIYLHTSLRKGSATYVKKYGTLFFYLITTNRRLFSHVIWQQCYRPLLSYFILVLSLTCSSYLKMAAGWHTCCWS